MSVVDVITPSAFISTSPVTKKLPRVDVQTKHVINDDSVEPTVIFDNVPPLFKGHPEYHIRTGIVNASRTSAAGEDDAERAFFVADLGQVYAQHERWVNALPDIIPHYAIKCNPDPYVLRLLASLGAGFDCASIGEIGAVLSLDKQVSPSRIIFANPCKAASFIKSASRSGVKKMTFDNADELHKIAAHYPDAELVLRILADDSKSLCRFGVKFGAPLEVVPKLMDTARALGLNVIGVSFHVGSGCYDTSVYDDAIARARAAFDMGASAGYKFTLLDLGGGFEDASFESAAKVIRESIAIHFSNIPNLQVIAEPGRFYVSKAFRLATNIIARRGRRTDEVNPEIVASKDPEVMYYINDGVYGAFNCIMYDHQVVTPIPMTRSGNFHIPDSIPTQHASVWGPTCDSIDLVCPSVQLPIGLEVGDWMAFEGMGAYTICAASQFNGFQLSKVVYTTGEKYGREVRTALTSFRDNCLC